MNSKPKIRKIGSLLVVLMAFLQAFYAAYAYYDPAAFAMLRGTILADSADLDWIRIYASRTLFIALAIGVLWWQKHWYLLMWMALLALCMPITDAGLAFAAGAPLSVVIKHVLIIVYLAITALVLRAMCLHAERLT